MNYPSGGSEFQFLYGAIGGFKSLGLTNLVPKFQFLYGAIGGLTRLIQTKGRTRFQFLYGAIGGQISLWFTYVPNCVSIPIWCDWW